MVGVIVVRALLFGVYSRSDGGCPYNKSPVVLVGVYNRARGFRKRPFPFELQDEGLLLRDFIEDGVVYIPDYFDSA